MHSQKIQLYQIQETSRIEIQAKTYSTEITIPRSYRAAKSLSQFPEWKKAMDSEINTMFQRKVGTPVPTKVIGTR